MHREGAVASVAYNKSGRQYDLNSSSSTLTNSELAERLVYDNIVH